MLTTEQFFAGERLAFYMYVAALWNNEGLTWHVILSRVMEKNQRICWSMWQTLLPASRLEYLQFVGDVFGRTKDIQELRISGEHDP